MVFLANLYGPLVFTFAIVGVQHDDLTTDKKQTISTLYSLLSKSADRIDHLQDENHGTENRGPRSTTFVAYWLESAKYKTFSQSNEWKQFWQDLADDAGVWKEIMTVPKSRYMFAANQQETSGLATMLGLKQSSDEAYWGVYRHRLAGNPDEHTDPADTFTTPLTSSKFQDGKRAINLSRTGVLKTIRRGRVNLNNLPDNLVYCREGQRQPGLPKEELETWKQKLAPHAQAWMEHLDTERNKNGVVSFTFNIGHEKPKAFDAGADLKLDIEAVAEANQLMYFLDLAHFERAGRSFKDHVTLRKNTYAEYGPNGKHSDGGKLSIWVELCVLKTGELEAEYVGCREGTGLMLFEDY